MQKADRYPWRYALYTLPYFLSASIFTNFISVYFQQLSLSERQVSWLMAAMPVVSILAQPLIGSLGDRAKNKTRLLRVLSLVSVGAVLLFPLSDHFAWLLPMTLIFSGCYSAQPPLGDAVILEALHERRRPYGPLRMLGCLVFACSSALAGRLLEGHMERIIAFTAVTVGLMFTGSFALPNIQGHQRGRGAAGFLALLKQSDLRHLLILVMLLQITFGYFSSFFSIHFLTLDGAGSQWLGISYFLSSFFEAPFLLLSDRLFARFGAGKLLVSVALVLMLRWIALAAFRNVFWVAAVQMLHGWGFVVIMVTMAKYINETVPPNLRARGQMLVSMVGTGLARVVGALAGVMLGGWIGLQNGFYVMAGIAALAFVLYAPRYLRRPALGKAQN